MYQLRGTHKRSQCTNFVVHKTLSMYQLRGTFKAYLKKSCGTYVYQEKKSSSLIAKKELRPSAALLPSFVIFFYHPYIGLPGL